jgi:alkylation response protein AidB-like acyl-CoA dehydrogenase
MACDLTQLDLSDATHSVGDTASRRHALCAAIAALVPDMLAHAAALDEQSAFPESDVAALRMAGAWLAPFPEELGGLGVGTTPSGGRTLLDSLCLLGRGNLSVGRLYEGHVNAIRLIVRHGTATQLARAAADVAQGAFVGLWVTDTPLDGLRAGPGGVLHGGKSFCSGAGHAGRALVSVKTPEGTMRLAYLATQEARKLTLASKLQGMRAAMTGRMCFEDCLITEDDYVGAPDAYLNEPDFSAGAWRTSAVTVGGLEAMVECAMDQLISRGRHGDPHQLARMGQAWIAKETAQLWAGRACDAAEAPDRSAGSADIVAIVNFARLAIESACLDALRLIERSLGLAAFLYPSPIERMRRDLAIYLRQPAPDEVLTEATAHIFRTRMEPC